MIFFFSLSIPPRYFSLPAHVACVGERTQKWGDPGPKAHQVTGNQHHFLRSVRRRDENILFFPPFLLSFFSLLSSLWPSYEVLVVLNSLLPYPFVEKAESSINKVGEQANSLEADYKGLLTYFGEDDMIQPEEFFSIPVKFSTDLKVCPPLFLLFSLLDINVYAFA